MAATVEIFLSYAHKDRVWKDKLVEHLSLLKQQGCIAMWYDQDISAGVEWQQAIREHLDQAQIILLLISSSFMASERCYCMEMMRALERHDTGEARIIPIILRPVDWQNTPFGKLQPLPLDGRPITRLSNKDKAFFEVSQGIRKAIEEVSMAQACVGEPVSSQDIKVYLEQEKYCTDLYNRYKMLDFKGIMHFDMNHPISIPLVDVFVFPDVQLGVPEHETLERDSEYFLFPYQSRQRARRVIRQREPLQDALVKHRRLVILGDPGSGKSTLLRYLLLQLAQGSNTFAATFPLLAAEETCVPLYMPLAAYAEVFLTNTPGTRSLVDFLPIYLRENYLSDYVDFLQGQLQQGNVFFLFDGLDEIPDAALRIKVVSQIELFTQSHLANRFIVTSRIVGYKEAPLSASEYQVYTLADFTEEQVKTFTQRWCPAYERWVNGFTESQHLEDAATKEAEKLFDATQSKPAVKRLAVNPLLLTILALIQRQGIELPSHRIELYRLCTETLIDTWVKAKGQSIQFSKNELIRILRPLAFWMHEHAAVGAIPQEEIHQQIVDQLVQRTLNEYEANRQAEQFLQIVRGKTGILVERGKERYGFLHLTFEEYFTARAVVLRNDRETFIKRHLHNPRWREVILLTVGTVGIIDNDEEKVTELVRAIVNANSPYEWALHRDLLFAGHCLADDIGVLPAYENEIIQNIVFLYLTSPHDGLRTACSSLLTAWSGTKVAEKAVQLALPILQQWVATTETKKTFVAKSPFEKRVAAHLEQLTTQQQDTITKHLHFDITIILASLQMLEQVDWKKNLLAIITSQDVKSKIATALEQGSSEQQSLITALIAGLSDPDANVRRKMISALGRLAPPQPELSDTVLSALSDSDFYVRRQAAKILAQLGKTQPALIDSLLASFEKENVSKDEIIDALGEVGEGHFAVIDTLLLALRGIDDEFARYTAAKALAKMSQGEPHVIDALLIALADQEYYVVDAVVRALKAIYEKKTCGSHISQISPVLSELTALADPNADVLQITAKALGELSSNPAQTTDLLLSSLSNAQQAKESAIKILGHLGKGHPHVLDTLLNIVLDASAPLNIRRAAVWALKYLEEKEPRAVDTLLNILSGPFDWSMRRAVASALGHLGDDQPRVIDTLLNIVSDAQVDDRLKEAAISALCQLGGSQPRVIDALLSVFATSSWSLRTEIVIALACLGKDDPRVISTLLSAYNEQPRIINALLRASSSSDPGTKAAIMNFFEQRGKDQPEMVDILLVALTDENVFTQDNARNMLIHLSEIHPHITHNLVIALSRTNLIQRVTEEYKSRNFGIVTSRAIDILGRVNSDHLNSVDAMFVALYDDDSHIARATTRTLVQLSKRRTHLLEKLLRTLPDVNEQAQHSVAEAFSGLSKKQGQQSIIDLFLLRLSDESWSMRLAAIQALGRVGKGQTRVIESLLSALSDTYWYIRYTVVRVLESLGKEHPQVIDAHLQALSDSSGRVRNSAAIALGNLGEKQPRITEALIQAFFGNSFLGREGACHALGQLGKEQPQVIEVLLPALSSPDHEIRVAAARTLGRLDEKQLDVVNVLLPLLTDSSWLVRSAAVGALGDLYGKQTAIVEALLPTLADPSIRVRLASARAFKNIIRENEDVQVVTALLQATYDSERRVREAAASALANAQSEIESIGTRIEELLRQCEHEEGSSSSLFDALRDIAEKTGIEYSGSQKS